MAENPKRNWTKIHTQMWHIAVCDPINKNSNFAWESPTKRFKDKLYHIAITIHFCECNGVSKSVDLIRATI